MPGKKWVVTRRGNGRKKNQTGKRRGLTMEGKEIDSKIPCRILELVMDPVGKGWRREETSFQGVRTKMELVD